MRAPAVRASRRTRPPITGGAAALLVCVTPGIAAAQTVPTLEISTTVTAQRLVTLRAGGTVPADSTGAIVVTVDQRVAESCPSEAAALPGDTYPVIGAPDDPLDVPVGDWEQTERFTPGAGRSGWWRICGYVDAVPLAGGETRKARVEWQYLVPKPIPLMSCVDAAAGRDAAGQDVYAAVVRPRACTVFGPGGGFAGGVNLARLRWSGWGRSTARATGIERGFHLPLASIPVTVRLTGLRHGCDGRRYYSRLRATSRYGSSTVRLRTCPG